jgi:hypothetical protein
VIPDNPTQVCIKRDKTHAAFPKYRSENGATAISTIRLPFRRRQGQQQQPADNHYASTQSEKMAPPRRHSRTWRPLRCLPFRNPLTQLLRHIRRHRILLARPRSAREMDVRDSRLQTFLVEDTVDRRWAVGSAEAGIHVCHVVGEK